MISDTRTDIKLKSEFLTDWSGKHLQVQIAHGELIGKLAESENENHILKLEVDSLREFHNSVAYSKGFKIMTLLRENFVSKFMRKLLPQ